MPYEGRSLARTNQFKRDYKRMLKRSRDGTKLLRVIEQLARGEKLDQKYRDHFLSGEYDDCRECRMEPDWLLIYQLTPGQLILIRTGTHTDLFE